MTEASTNTLEMTADIVAAFVSRNTVAPAEVAALISATYAALSSVGTPPEGVDEPAEKISPAQVRKSIKPGGLVSFLDGRTYQSLKRHLAAQGLTPDAYRARFGLPHDYPMVSPAYSARRSELARSAGLGRGGRKPRTKR